MSTAENEDIKINSSVPTDMLRKMKVRCGFSISYEQFLAFEDHAKKTGGKFVCQLVDALRPEFEKVKQALALLK